MSSHIVSPKFYFGIFAALMVLTAITVGISSYDLGPFNLPVALTIAVMKSTLIILFFMHVKFSSKLTKVFALAGLFWLSIMFYFTFCDYLGRNLKIGTLP